MIENMLAAMSDMARRDRSRYHLTLGDLIAVLKDAEPSAKVVTSDGKGVGRLYSYRGYYADLALNDGSATAGELLANCEQALDAEFTGYKGGEFLMGENTPLWFAEYGCCGPAIVSAFTNTQGQVVLNLKDID